MAKTAAKKPLDAVEEEARQVIEVHLGAPVVQHDDNSAPSMPDLRIVYPDRPHGAVEVVRDVMQARAQQRDALDQHGGVMKVEGLTQSWGVHLTPGASIRAVRSALPSLLKEADTNGGKTVQALPWSGLDPLAYRLFQLKVHMLTPLSLGPSGPIAMLIAPNFFSWNGDPEVIVTWCEALLQQEDDVPAKLAASPFAERHAYLVPTQEGDLTIYRAEFTDPPGGGQPVMPTTAPVLPGGVDQLWIRGLDRVIRWSATTGWTQVEKP